MAWAALGRVVLDIGQYSGWRGVKFSANSGVQGSPGAYQCSAAGALWVASAAQWAAAARIDGADIRVAVAHHAADLLVAPALPLADRVLTVPGLVGASVELGQFQLVAFGHIQIDTRCRTTRMGWRHGGFRLEVDHHRAGAVLRGFVAEHAEGVVGAVTIQLTDAWHQVVQVGFGGFEAGVVARAVLASAVLPALALMADYPSGHHMLPFQSLGTAQLFAGAVATAAEGDAVTAVRAMAIEGAGPFGIQPPGDFLRGTEGFRGIGKSG